MSQYCSLLFRNLYVQKLNQAQVKLAYCCQAKKSQPTDNADFDNDFLAEGRNFFLLHKKLPNACKSCIDLESKGATSFRLQTPKELYPEENTNPELTYIHYSCDPICNLKCIMCDGQWSSAWISDEIALGLRTDFKIAQTKHNNLIWNLNLQNIRSIYFNGGEPLLTHDHIKFLQKFDINQTKQMTIAYSTNGTIFPSDQALEIWSRFREVNLQFSIDSIEESFKYIRFPAQWNQIQENLYKLKNLKFANLFFFVTPNIGLHNIYYLEDLIKWSINENLRIVPNPTSGILSIQNFPLHLKDNLILHSERLQKKYETFISMESYSNIAKSISEPNLNWIKFLGDLDKIRNTNWKTSLARLYQLDPVFFNSWSG